MAKSVKSRTGRVVSGLMLAGAVVGLVIVLQVSAEQRSWASAEATVLERLKSGRSASVKVEYPLPDGSKQVATLSENGSAHHPGERVTVRYDLRDGRVVDAALADNDQVFWVLGVMLGVLAAGSVGMNLIAWAPPRRCG
ncbi:hypothetical protein SAMN04488074_101735 [Lentzea albidocapillata subsp. violacea]|uniref:DUF3592 domain-containing protein n=1 Tax=Lentzea albidocapillata subsp. violacea TaxID=128104 RepID=A0A1G8RNK2_9PSEU|nr:DUF3592 domain-containing protein [Lentzea albidocapillata]SDJ18526.1 hypothetical protein SAMN04488074_101735 [Lentzea albidocapillata subsp. violacea]